MTEESIENHFQQLTDEELKESEIALLAATDRKEPVTDEEYERHYEWIRRVRKTNPSTHKQFTKKSKYSDERIEAQKLVLARLHELSASVPSEGKALFIGGMPGSGKTSTLELHAETLLPGDFFVTNPDIVKELMVQFGLQPHIPGLLPLETDELIRYEAGILDGEFLQKLMNARKNIVLDRTMASVSQITKLAHALRANGYKEIRGAFMDIDPELGYERIRARHRRGLDRYLLEGLGVGERPVPGSAVVASRPAEGSPFKTSNAESFYELAKQEIFSEPPRVYNENGLEVSLESLKD